MGYCFVIQPFDGGVFQKRYEDVFAPAIESTSLSAYRVDGDPSVSIIIDEIEKRIRAADVCLADISTNNPNVWFELGYALACQKEVVLVCDSSRREHFPFDIQHRNIITYATDSLRDFQELKAKITKKLQAALEKEKQIEAAAAIPTATQVGGLAQHEVVALIAVAQNQEILETGAPAHLVRKDMEKAGFTRIAGTLGLKGIVAKGLAEVHEAYTAGDEAYSSYSITGEGYSWLLSHQEGLALRRGE